MRRKLTIAVLVGVGAGCSTTYECNVYDVDEGLLYSAEYEAGSASEAEEICEEDGGGYAWLYCACE